MRKVKVDLGKKSYDIVIGYDLVFTNTFHIKNMEIRNKQSIANGKSTSKCKDVP